MVAAAEHGNFGYQVGEPLLKPNFSRLSYGYNAHGTVLSWGYHQDVSRQLGLGAWIIPGEPGNAAELKASRVRKPMEMIAVADIDDGPSLRGTGMSFGGQGERPGRVHRGGANVLFCDGHVQWHRQSDLVWVEPGPLTSEASRTGGCGTTQPPVGRAAVNGEERVSGRGEALLDCTTVPPSDAGSHTPSPLPSPGGRGRKGADSSKPLRLVGEILPLPPGEGGGEGMQESGVRCRTAHAHDVDCSGCAEVREVAAWRIASHTASVCLSASGSQKRRT